MSTELRVWRYWNVKVLVIGADGRVGRRLVAGGAARGHEMTAGVHRSDGGPRPHAVSTVACDVLDHELVKQAVRGHDVVIVAVSSGSPFRPGSFHSTAAQNVVGALEGQGRARLLWMSSVGTGTPYDPNLPPVLTRVLQPFVFGRLFEQFQAAEAIVAGSSAEWTILHLPRLTNGEALGIYRSQMGHSLPGGHRISRRDVADFVLKELESRLWLGRHVAIAY